jgi:hypothetical protein
MLNKEVLINYENDEFSWVELKKVRHIKHNEFKIHNENNWYSIETIVNVPKLEEFNSGFCVNCKLPVLGKNLCNGTYCTNSFQKETDVGFSTLDKSEKFRDKRIKVYYTLRQNLWDHSHNEENDNMFYDDKLYCIKKGKFMPKSHFADRRLKWENRGKRYNLHGH